MSIDRPQAPAGAPGWYPDPSDSTTTRWWDGEAWTGYVQAGSAVTWDELPEVADEAALPALAGLPTATAGFAVGVALALAARELVDGVAVWEGLWASAGLWLGLTAAALVVSRRRGTGSPIRDLGLRIRWVDVGVGLGASLAARVLTGVAAAPLPLPWTRVRDLPQAEHLQGAGQWVAAILVTCVGAPLFEELFFRGLLQPQLVARLGAVPGIAVTALLFGAAHLLGWTGPSTFVLAWAIAVGGGLALGALRHHSGRLGPSLMAHVFFNVQATVAVALLG